jgi:hypothetical protein
MDLPCSVNYLSSSGCELVSLRYAPTCASELVETVGLAFHRFRFYQQPLGVEFGGQPQQDQRAVSGQDSEARRPSRTAGKSKFVPPSNRLARDAHPQVPSLFRQRTTRCWRQCRGCPQDARNESEKFAKHTSTGSRKGRSGWTKCSPKFGNGKVWTKTEIQRRKFNKPFC